MPSLAGRLRLLGRRYSSRSRQRGAVLRAIAKQYELVHFGLVHPDDDIEPIRGFTSSVTHIDEHYCVGSYDGHPIRLIDRFDIVKFGAIAEHAQNWLIIEVTLHPDFDAPHTLLMPTGAAAREYHRFLTTQPHLQPLNTTVFRNHSPELHGRFQILARPSKSADVEELLPSPLLAGVAARFWPHGVEINDNTLYVYITDHRLDKTVVASTLAATLWLADALNGSPRAD